MSDEQLRSAPLEQPTSTKPVAEATVESLAPRSVLTADQEILISETGVAYLRKRPLSHQPLFWVSIALGVVSLILFSLMNTYWSEKQDIEAALRREGLYYDSFYQEIYADDAAEWVEETPYVRERLTDETLAIIDQMELAPETLTLSEVEQPLLELETAVRAYLDDLSLELEDAYNLGEVSDDEYETYTADLVAYEEDLGDVLETIRELYENKEPEKWDSRDKDVLNDHLSYLLDPDAQIFDQMGVQAGVSV